MFTKYVCLVLLTIVAIQAFPDVKLVNNDLRDVWADANRVLKKLKENLDQMVKDSEANLKNALTELTKQTEIIIKESNLDVQLLLADSLSKVNKIKKEAEELGLDITKCLSGEEQKIKDVEKKFTENQKACTTGKIEAATRISQTAVTEIRKVLTKYDGMKKKVEACKSSSDQEVCVNAALQEILDELIEISFHVSQLVVEAETQINGIAKGIENCVEGKVVAAQTEANKIVNDFSKCVNAIKPYYC